MIDKAGQVAWGPIIAALPVSERVPFTLHPNVRITGTLPPHLPIIRFEQVRKPLEGLVCSTESGLHTQVFCENTALFEILWSQIQAFNHPTWSELVQQVSLPRQIELARTTASEILRFHHEHTQRESQMKEFLTTCLNHLHSCH